MAWSILLGSKKQEGILTSVLRVVNYRLYQLLENRQMITRQEAGCIYDTDEPVVRFCFTQTNLTGKIPNALLARLANLNDTFEICGESEG